MLQFAARNISQFLKQYRGTMDALYPWVYRWSFDVPAGVPQDTNLFLNFASATPNGATLNDTNIPVQGFATGEERYLILGLQCKVLYPKVDHSFGVAADSALFANNEAWIRNSGNLTLRSSQDVLFADHGLDTIPPGTQLHGALSTGGGMGAGDGRADNILPCYYPIEKNGNIKGTVAFPRAGATYDAITTTLLMRVRILIYGIRFLTNVK
jgi:hypothetical protein